MSKGVVYLAGHCLDRGSQLQRAEERDMVKSLGYEVYCPQDNKEINDKKNAVQEGLAERIVEHDTDAIHNSDVIIIEPQVHAVGTCVELGQLLGEYDLAHEISEVLETTFDTDDTIRGIQEIVDKVLKRKILPHNSDVRRQNTSLQAGDRREYGAHQYVYGAVLKLTGGKGFYDMSEIEEILSE